MEPDLGIYPGGPLSGQRGHFSLRADCEEMGSGSPMLLLLMYVFNDIFVDVRVRRKPSDRLAVHANKSGASRAAWNFSNSMISSCMTSR